MPSRSRQRLWRALTLTLTLSKWAVLVALVTTAWTWGGFKSYHECRWCDRSLASHP
ncbi:hypothetical protein ASPFODRAFT_52447 [Aspergillus luchuensis CBS 106.47]|uniref:Uncharacterized protein n=1 Tax=Aspergillus luchuensis (strain CBS 106.47) TaxID=1137211 RepID=A0A1M3T3P4_ASPLC|nr:hypothetical protein ASPFODRAFT_52447 [Aspergillus luchuensis CBS 106.47]